MKNVILPGLIIGLLSGAWLLIMRALGYTSFTNEDVAPIELVSVFIPIIGLYYGVKTYRNGELKGQMNFLEALIHSFKILIAAGIIVVFLGIVYINYIESGNNFRDFSGRIFAALLIGVLAALAVSLLLTSQSKKLIRNIFIKYFELLFWIAALAALAIADPSSGTHFTLCPLKLAGISWCPGCGLGHSISWLFHGDIHNSLYAHWLGIPAVIIIVYRIYTLINQRFTDRKSISAC